MDDLIGQAFFTLEKMLEINGQIHAYCLGAGADNPHWRQNYRRRSLKSTDYVDDGQTIYGRTDARGCIYYKLTLVSYIRI